MNLVVDATIAVRWFVAAPRWEAARALKEPGVQFFAPEIVLADIGDLLERLVAERELESDDAKLVMHTAPKAFARLFPVMLLRDRALAIALEHKLSIARCFYLALAEWEGAPLVTGDDILHGAANDLKNVEARLLAA